MSLGATKEHSIEKIGTGGQREVERYICIGSIATKEPKVLAVACVPLEHGVLTDSVGTVQVAREEITLADLVSGPTLSKTKTPRIHIRASCVRECAPEKLVP